MNDYYNTCSICYSQDPMEKQMACWNWIRVQRDDYLSRYEQCLEKPRKNTYPRTGKSGELLLSKAYSRAESREGKATKTRKAAGGEWD